MNTIRPIAETADTVTIARKDFEALMEALEDAGDLALLARHRAEEERRGSKAARADYLPAEAVERLLGGESPVRVWRGHRAMTARALAAAAGVSPSYLCEIEAGRKPGSARALKRLADALGIGIDDLMAWID